MTLPVTITCINHLWTFYLFAFLYGANRLRPIILRFLVYYRLVIMMEKHVAYNRAGANRNLLNLDCDPVGANHKMERSLRIGGRLTGKKMDASM